MSLACGCDGDNFASFYQSNYRKARKPHKCAECGKKIQPGELYEYAISVYEGDFTARKTCEKCSDLADSLADVGFCWPLGDLALAYKEYLDEYVPGAVRYDEENDRYIYPSNHLIDENGDRRRHAA